VTVNVTGVAESNVIELTDDAGGAGVGLELGMGVEVGEIVGVAVGAGLGVAASGVGVAVGTICGGAGLFPPPHAAQAAIATSEALRSSVFI
jgi:hypothetical protein